MLLNLSGAHAPYFSRIVLIITDETGVEGISEIPCSTSILNLLNQVSDQLRGANPFRYKSLVASILDEYNHLDVGGRGNQTFDQRTAIHVATAVEAALLDLVGKIMGLPVCELLGKGIQRRSIPFLGYLFFVGDSSSCPMDYRQEIAQPSRWQANRRKPALDAASIVAQAELVGEEYGFTDFKLKGGVFSAEKEVECILALKDAFPDAGLTLDPNGCWDIETALETAKRLAGKVVYLEDPCGAQDSFSSREMMALFKELSGLPTATNMVATNLSELAHAIKLSAVDVPLADPHFWGMEQAVLISEICKLHNLTWGVHSNNHFDISLAMVCQVTASAVGKITPMDTHWIWQEGQSLTVKPPKIVRGQIDVADTPGLGIELDRDALGKAHNLFLKAFSVDRDDSMAMQYLIAGWSFDANRPCLVR